MPTIASSIGHRSSKLFVTSGAQKLTEMPHRGDESDARRPTYEARLLEGINRIEVEMVAGLPRGAPKVGPGQEIESEKITVFVNIARS